MNKNVFIYIPYHLVVISILLIHYSKGFKEKNQTNTEIPTISGKYPKSCDNKMKKSTRKCKI